MFTIFQFRLVNYRNKSTVPRTSQLREHTNILIYVNFFAFFTKLVNSALLTKLSGCNRKQSIFRFKNFCGTRCSIASLEWCRPVVQVKSGLVLPFYHSSDFALVASIVYGQTRKRSGTVWTAILMHGFANTFLFSVIGDGSNVKFHNKVVAFFGF